MILSLLFIFWVLLLVILLLGGAFLNLLGLAGNWVMLGSMVAHRFIADPESVWAVHWSSLVLLLFLALLGEALEFVAGLMGAGKAGSSKRGLILAFAGSIFGASIGFGLGNAVVPVLGGIVGVFLLGAGGALLGAVLGETWKGRSLEESMEVGRGAFVGRLIGTLSKSFVGAAMLLVSLGALFI